MKDGAMDDVGWSRAKYRAFQMSISSISSISLISFDFKQFIKLRFK